jgi:hypothetical protein
MLVTSDGVQMPSKSRDIAAVPELMGLKATVVSMQHNHLADVRIALKTLTWSFISIMIS